MVDGRATAVAVAAGAPSRALLEPGLAVAAMPRTAGGVDARGDGCLAAAHAGAPRRGLLEPVTFGGVAALGDGCLAGAAHAGVTQLQVGATARVEATDVLLRTDCLLAATPRSDTLGEGIAVVIGLGGILNSL